MMNVPRPFIVFIHKTEPSNCNHFILSRSQETPPSRLQIPAKCVAEGPPSDRRFQTKNSTMVFCG